MSDRTALRDRLVKATKLLTTEIGLAKNNPDLSESARAKHIAAARRQFTERAQDILDEVKPRERGAAQRSAATTSPDAFAELKEVLHDAGNPTLAVLDLLARGTDELIETVASQDGLQLIEKVLRKRGEPESTVQQTMQQLASASSKRSQQPGLTKPATTEQPEASTADRFWNYALPTFVTDVNDALDHGHRQVVFPATPGTGEQPIEIMLSGEDQE